MTDGARGVSLTQLAYSGKKTPVIGGTYALALGYTYANNSKPHRATPFGFDVGETGTSNSFGVSGYWIPEQVGWIPSVSLGWGMTSSENAAYEVAGVTADYGNSRWAQLQSWQLGLQWADVFVLSLIHI